MKSTVLVLASLTAVLLGCESNKKPLVPVVVHRFAATSQLVIRVECPHVCEHLLCLCPARTIVHLDEISGCCLREDREHPFEHSLLDRFLDGLYGVFGDL